MLTTLQRPEDSLFSKFVSGEIPIKKVFEDDHCIAFNDIAPQAPVHVLIIPKVPISGIAGMGEEDKNIVGHLYYVASKLARQLNIHDSGYRVVTNNGDHGQQTVYWLHLHLMGGRQLTWPPG